MSNDKGMITSKSIVVSFLACLVVFWGNSIPESSKTKFTCVYIASVASLVLCHDLHHPLNQYTPEVLPACCENNN